MALNFNNLVNNTQAPRGRGNGNAQNQEQRDPAKFWLNIGFPAEGVEEGDKYAFISPQGMGIALDNLEPQPIRGSNEEFNGFRADCNALLERIMKLASQLRPGETRLTKLVVQVRRVQDDAVAPQGTNSKFIQEVELV